MKTIAIVMFDKRQEACADALEQKGFEVIRIHHQNELDAFFRASLWTSQSAILLPVRGVDENAEIVLPNQETLNFQAMPPMHVFAGIPNPVIASWKLPTTYLMQEESVIEANALLTAQGVLATVLDNINLGLREVGVDVIGYGHCGTYLVDFFHGLKMNVRVIRRNTGKPLPAGVTEIDLATWQQLPRVNDIVINTAPSMVIDQITLANKTHRPLWIDIASKPGGMDYRAAKELQHNFIVAPSLPPLYTPVSAGKIFATAIEKEMNLLE